LNYPVTEDEINQWFAGTLNPNHPATKDFSYFDSRLDPWGHPYRCVSPKASPDGQSTHDVGVYSMGQDGVSESNGNDPDDINSWDDHHRRFYLDQIATRKRTENVSVTIVLMPVIYACVLWAESVARRMRLRKRKGAAETPRRGECEDRSDVE
jgi:hypothetical protein